MSMPGGGPQSRDPGAQRWGAEQEQIDKAAEQAHLAHELERAEPSEPPRTACAARPRSLVEVRASRPGTTAIGAEDLRHRSG